MGFDARVFIGDYLGPFRHSQAILERRAEAALLVATHRNAKRGLGELRAEMASAGLGRLGFALTSSSDAESTGKVHRSGNGFSASGMIHHRKKISERSRGAIDIYSTGGTISPTGNNGPWEWIATDQIPKRVGRRRMTPRLYKQSGLVSRLGPLVMVRRANGLPLLVVPNIGFNVAGRARSLNARGGLRRGQVSEGSIVAFVAIPFTTRTKRIDFTAKRRKMQAQLPADFVQAYKETL